MCWVGRQSNAVNNAGLAMGTAKVGEIRAEDLDAMFETNVRGLIYMTQLYVRQCKERRAGHIINIGSIAGLEPYPGGSVVRASSSHSTVRPSLPYALLPKRS